MSPRLCICWANFVLFRRLTSDRNMCVFSATLMPRTRIFLCNSSDDITPGRNPIALYQSQQVDIIQREVRCWAQIFAQAGKLGSWVGAWERTEESGCNRETYSSRTQQQVQQTIVYCNNKDIYWNLTHLWVCVCDCLRWGNSAGVPKHSAHVLTRLWKLTDVGH